MATLVQLDKNYRLKITGGLSIDLCKRTVSKQKSGGQQELWPAIKYFTKVEDALNGYVEQRMTDDLKDEVLTLQEYIVEAKRVAADLATLYKEAHQAFKNAEKEEA